MQVTVFLFLAVAAAVSGMAFLSLLGYCWDNVIFRIIST